MISGAHTMIFSKDAEADKAFLRDVLGFAHVDAGDGFLIFGIPIAEIAVHEGKSNDAHELYLMCDDVNAFLVMMKERGADCSPVVDRGWGLLTSVGLPGGGRLSVYQPKHLRPQLAKAKPAARKTVRKKKSRKAPKRKK